MDAVKKYKATPEDQETEKWLYDEDLHLGLIEFDEKLAEIMDPYWEKIYLKYESIKYNSQLPFTSPGPPQLKIRFI